MRSLAQIAAIAACEFRVQWRRSGLLVLTLGMLVIPVAIAIGMTSQLHTMSSNWVISGAMNAGETRRHLALAILPLIWSPVYVVLALLLPILTADAVPRDRQTGGAAGWGELLDSLPLPGGVYLAGKLLGVWISALAGCLIAMLITGVAWWLLIGPFDLWLYLQEWLFGAAALAILNGGLSVMLAVPQPSPRRAAAVGVLISLASLIWLMLSPMLKPGSTVKFLDLVNLARPVLFVYFFQLVKAPGANQIGAPVDGWDVFWTILAGLLEIALVGLAAWSWMRRSGPTSPITITPDEEQT